MRMLRTPRGGLLLIGMAAAIAALALALGAFGPLTPTARADLPSGEGCPAAAGSGTVLYQVSATLPAGAGQNANGVCINCSGTGGANNSAFLVQNATGCIGVALPTVGAGSSYVWADWGTNNCVAPGNTVKIRFNSGGTLPAVVSVKWNLADNSVIDGTGSVIGPVGGIAELPSLAGVSGEEVGESTGGSGWPAGGYAALAGGLAVALAVVGGAWYARRRFTKS